MSCLGRFFLKLILLCFFLSFFLAGCSEMPASLRASSFSQTPVPNTPNKVALLLPLSGGLASSSQAIRNGFFAAYYHHKQESLTAPEIQVFDTTQGDIISIYQQAVHQGAKVIIGPLTKDDVIKLAQWNQLSVPTLALNSIGVGPIHNLFQFGLSPIDEAQQAALRAWTDGYRQTLVLAPNTSWGHANANVFIQQFQQYGGTVVDQAYYNDQSSLDPTIRQLLQINSSIINNKRASSLHKRRQDADMIFLIAPPEFARQIKPLLNYYFAGDLPVYATSHVYQGVPNPSLDGDLNGIQFCDMPWTINSQNLVPGYLNNVRSNIMQAWPDSFAAQPRLYALGVDAYDVIALLQNMQASPRYIVDAATGMLTLTSQQRISRQLYWAHFQNGVPQSQ